MKLTRVYTVLVLVTLVLAPVAAAVPLKGAPTPITTLGDDPKVGGMGCG